MPRFRPHLLDDQEIEEPLINLTPLIDVVFVVLIAFMMIAPILDVDKIQLAPGPNASPYKEDSLSQSTPLSIMVREDNTIWVDRQQISLSDLGKWLEREKARHPTAVPKLIQDSRAQFGTYQAIKNRVEACGFEELDVVLQPR